MIKFNTLTESMVSNEPVVNQRDVNPEEFDLLVEGSSGALSFSGSTINLLIDFGAQKSIDKLVYEFLPLSTSGLSIEYGRTLESMVSGSLLTSGTEIQVVPSISGYTYPRYFRLTHEEGTGSSEITLNNFSILNTDDEVEFGSSGVMDSISVVSNQLSGYTEVYEVPVFNNHTIPTTLYVGADPDNESPLEVFERLEFSTTLTGTFLSVASGISVPETVPWQWGVFENINVTDDNKLQLDDPSVTIPSFDLYEEVSLLAGNGTSSNFFSTTLSDGSQVAAQFDNLYRLVFYDPIRNAKTTAALPAVIPTNSTRGQHIAWDNFDKLYYIFNSTDQTIRYYDISANSHGILATVSGYYFRQSRGVVHVDNDLYIFGASTSVGTDTTKGTKVIKVNITTLAVTELLDLPATPTSELHVTRFSGDNYVYALFTLGDFYRYDITTNLWQQLAPLPGNFYTSISANDHDGLVWLVNSSDDAYRYSPINGQFESTPLFDDIISNSPTTSMAGIAVDGSFLVAQSLSASHGYATVARVLRTDVPAPALPISISGYWLSPTFRLDNSDWYHRILFDINESSGAEVKFDNSISTDNFQVRGSDLPPASDNLLENFDTEIDRETYFTAVLNDYTLITTSGGDLTFSHDFVDTVTTEYNTGYLYFSFPFSTTGEMQYKFEWKPPTDRITGSKLSKFNLVPFLDTIDLGLLPERDIETLDRTEDNEIYLELGKDSDSGGDFSGLQLYNGSTKTSFNANISSGSFNTIEWIINWETGSYQLLVNGQSSGSGTIPQIRLALLRPQHTYEFYSASQDVDTEESFKFLTVSRVGNEPVSEEEVPEVGIPVHRSDPLFGTSSSLPWTPVTTKSPLIPKTKYIQFKLTLRSDNQSLEANVNSIRFPVIIPLEDVQPLESKSVYIRYNFDSTDVLVTNQVNIKAWMFTDKE